MKKNICCIAFFTICSITAMAQAEEKTKFKLGVFYNTGLNYYGRTDTLNSSGIFPLAELWFDDHFYINAAPVFVNNKISSMSYAGTVVMAGYQSKSKNKKWFTHLYAVKPFYEKDAQLVQSALKWQGSLAISHLNKILNITAGADAKFSDEVDFSTSAGLDHAFRKQFADHSILVINPSVYLYAGTQKLTNTYFKQNSFLLFPGIPQQVSEQVNSFDILAYEFSVPVVFAKGKLQLLCSPAFVIPQNLINGDQGKEMFYATLGAKMTF